ncbi:uncharacterized protein [Dermacentor andersoni]|uniref:uncharacterized protein n=1 Tax=Dermacentor andersoni TaxID=34620 RepID=UPI003B3AFFC6
MFNDGTFHGADYSRRVGKLYAREVLKNGVFFSPAEKQDIEGLRNNASIAILPAANGNAIVLLNRSDYNEKMKDLLSDEDTLRGEVRDIPLDEDDVMVSFDGKPLFTSVPVDLAVSTCRNVLLADDTLAERTPLEVQDICELLDFCLSNTYFTYDKQFYRQINGNAMGASISVTTANLIMEVIEPKAVSEFAPAPKVFIRYVDDCVCIVRRQDALRLLRLLKSAEAVIQFTTEYEWNETLICRA